MSIETRIPQEEIDIKQLNVEQPEQGEVYFDEQKLLPDAIWEKFKEDARVKLDRYLSGTDPRKRELDLRSYGSRANDYYILSQTKGREMPTHPDIEEIKDKNFKENLTNGKWSRVVGLMMNYLMSQPEKLKEIKFSEGQYHELVNRIKGEFKHEGETNGYWDTYLTGHLLLKHLYPNEPEKWMEIPPETLAKAKETFNKEDSDSKLLLKILLPGQASDYPISNETKLEYYKDLIEAKRKENWNKYHEAVLKLKLAEAEEVSFTPQGIEIKVRVPKGHVEAKSPTLPEVKKF